MIDEHKSSEDRIREARRRLQRDQGLDPGIEPERDEETTPSHAPPGPEPGPSEYVPHRERRQGEGADPSSIAATGPVADEARSIAAESRALDFGTSSGRANGPSWYARPWVRWVAILALAGGYGLFTSFGEADRDGSGEIVTGGEINVMAVEEGDCFDDPTGDEEVVSALDAVPCSEPHDNEIFAIESIAASYGSEYPGQETLLSHSYEICTGSVFATYVGTDYPVSDLDVFTLTPTEDSWDEGDREVVCALFRVDLNKLNGSSRDSGI